MYHFTKETAKQKVMEKIADYRKCIALIESIIPVVEKYNGKVVNKRFETALRKVNDRIRANIHYARLEIVVYSLPWHMEDDGITPRYGESCGYDLITKAYTHADSNRYGYIVTENDNGNHRLIAAEAIKGLREMAEEYQNKINENLEALEHVDEYIAEVSDIERRVAELQKIPYVVRDFFDLKIYTRRD